uniref:ATP synthase subunit a n=1 Tax=Paduniella communis TaxID=2904892 RepID=A0A9E8RSN0_9NEOP|nr:ATP synthase F0 subunit 6 [Paduniella communis]UZZ44251.1 ATP synthase F0 subunit 6 [Paduniella communis]
MMNNLFLIFDPSTYIKLSLNWISSLLIMMLLPMMFWIIPSRIYIMMWLLMNKLMEETKEIIKNNNMKLMFITIFLFIMLNNFMGLFPYIFTSTSHISTNLTFALPIWLSLMIFGWLKNMNHMFIHLIPQGTPLILMPFMVMIETISNIIRPLTLTVRLTANMIAGHLLLTLLSSLKNHMNIIMIPSLLFIQIILLMLEMSVAIIQAYVFMVLISLYMKETN